jgi:hypothetical protein
MTSNTGLIYRKTQTRYLTVAAKITIAILLCREPATNMRVACALLAIATVTRRLPETRLRACAFAIRRLLSRCVSIPILIYPIIILT